MAFYRALPEARYASQPATVGPWDAQAQHGGPPAALLAHVLDKALPRPDMRVARIAYDFHGPVPAAVLGSSAEPIRPGSRVELSRARLSAGGRTVLEATVWRIVVAPDRAPEVRDRRQPPPVPGPQEQRLFADVPSFPYGEAMEWRFVEGGFAKIGPATCYARPRMAIVDGEATTDLQRLLVMVDSGNGISAELHPTKHTFVPVELTVSITRYPRTEWVGMSARTTIDPQGIGQTHIDLFDEESYFGTALQTLFVAPK